MIEDVEREEDDGVLSADQQQLQHRVRHHHLQHGHPCNDNSLIVAKISFKNSLIVAIIYFNNSFIVAIMSLTTK